MSPPRHRLSQYLALCLSALAAALLSACTAVPEGLKPVQNFEAASYLGTWFEIARLDHSFERGLSDVSATYSRRDDGGIDVLNRGFEASTGKWQEAYGRAYFLDNPGVASLKVTFFWPFYGGYHVIALDPGYRYAMIAGPSREYLWILARDKQLPQPVLEKLLAQAKASGFATDQLIFVSHQH